MEKTIIDAIEKKIGYEFSNKALLIQAFTRESYTKEQRVKGIDCNSNEQLEYFGDSVLNYLVVSGQLDYFTKTNEEIGLQVLYKEGKLSEFNSHWTNKKMLSQCIEALGLAQYLIMSKGDIKQEANKTDSVKEDLFESIVGAMWIDSDKDVLRIQDKVFKMLGISFESAEVEKNYVSRLMEHCDKNKYKLEKKITQLPNGYEVEYTIILDYLTKEDKEWSEKGAGKNIKEAEQNAARNLIVLLEKFGFITDNNVIPLVDYTMDNAINVLQELNQKGYIGDITYTDTLCFSSEKKPYWNVECKISNYIMTFNGNNESKKQAKKEAAYSVLRFIKYTINKNNDYNPAYKKFRFLFNTTGVNHEFKVYIIDKFEGSLYSIGTVFPENKQLKMFTVGDAVASECEDMIEFYDDPIEAIVTWFKWYGCEKTYADENIESIIKLYVEEEYKKLPLDVKTNGVLLRDALLDIIYKFDK